ncbi:MAG TPA: TCP-1/cpn60 chaperonin family protein, partial [Candidatus Thermoplasmatota archaeon]|nr:TCP-1/cpn60 chaperonin family protein [Candidatus Thermoplasmatota archaeon]
MMSGQQPIIVLKEGTKRERGKNAQENNIAAARAISESVKSTLGPKGMDKMLVDSMGDVVITNDGATILKEIDVEHPSAKMIVEVAKSQDEECGDGTTTAVVLTGE